MESEDLGHAVQSSHLPLCARQVFNDIQGDRIPEPHSFGSPYAYFVFHGVYQGIL